MIPKRAVKHEESVDSWLMSYADMITLLLCFFIIFVSVSEPKKDKITEIAEGMSGKFGAVNYETPLLGAIRSLKTEIEVKKLYKDVAIETRPNGLSVELATQSFFKDGGADIDDEMEPSLKELLNSLKQSDLTPYNIVIESYTDDSQPQSGLYKTNWELSSVRAAKLAAYFTQHGFSADQIKAVGFGETRSKVPNRDEKGKVIEANRAKNQRVTIKLETKQ
jgi:chemotaxis protein MotB